MLCLGLGAWQLTRPDALLGIHAYNGLGYDDGVYLGAAVRLVRGALPYRDFAFVHPPGIAILMTPVALLGRLVGTRDALAVARVVTIVVAALNALLAGLAVRHRGPAAVAVAGVGLACFPLAVAGNHTLLLEPYVVFFCLLGTVVAFTDGELASRRRVFLGGLAFGFAGLVKIWAALPVLALLCVCLLQRRKAIRPAVAGMVVGFGGPGLPFILAAPAAFFGQVVLAQLGRGSTGALDLSAAQRAVRITGLAGLPALHAGPALAVALGVAVMGFVAVAYATSVRRLKSLDWYVLGAAALAVAAMFAAPESYDHYVSFSAPFIVVVLAASAGLGIEWVRSLARFPGRARVVAAVFPRATAVVAALVIGGFVVPQEVTYAREYLAPADDPGAQIARVVPTGACVVSDLSTLPMVADRFVPARPGCPPVIDPFGLWLVDDDHQPPPAPPPFPEAFVAKWRSWLEAADDVVLSVPFSDYIPWTPDLIAWFNRSYRLVFSLERVYVYEHQRPATPGATGLPGSPAALLQQGLDAQAAGRLDQARRLYLEVLAKDPANTVAHYDLGVIHQQEGAAKEAENDYEQALATDAGFRPALFNLAVLVTPTDPARAIALYRRLLAIEPNDANVLLNLGLLLVQAGRADEGRADLAAAVRINPSLASRVPAGSATTTTTTTTRP